MTQSERDLLIQVAYALAALIEETYYTTAKLGGGFQEPRSQAGEEILKSIRKVLKEGELGR